MLSSAPHPRRGSTRLGAILGAFVLLTAVVTFGASAPAAASSPGIDKVIDDAKQTGRNPDGTFPTGSTVTYTVAVSCQDDGGAPDCTGYQLTDPNPTYTDVSGGSAALPFVGATAGATALTVVSTNPVVITFDTPLAVGDSANVDITYQIPAWVVPDQTTLSNTATWGPAGGTVTSPTVDVVARAKAAWRTDKSGPTTVNINTQAVYTVQVCATNPNDGYFGPLNSTMTGATLIDALPASPGGTTLVVHDTNGGTYDPTPAAGAPNGVVTWTLGDLSLTNGGCESRTVTLEWTTPTPLAAQESVTNSVDAAGTVPAGTDFDQTAALNITLKNTSPGDPSIQKTNGRTPVDLDLLDDGAGTGDDGDSITSYSLRPRNTGESPMTDVVVTDTIPDHFVVTEVRSGTWSGSATGGDGLGNVSFTLEREVGADIVFTAAGSSEVVQTIPTAGTDDVTDLTIDFGDVSTNWGVSSGRRIDLVGYMVSPGRSGTTLDLVANRTVPVTNTARIDAVVTDAVGNQSTDSAANSATIDVVAPQPAPTIAKTSTVASGPVNGAAVYPTAVIEWSVTVGNPASTATAVYPDPEIYDILPNLTGTGLGPVTDVTVDLSGAPGLTFDEGTVPGDNLTETRTVGGDDLLGWRFTGDLEPDETITVSFRTEILEYTPPQTMTNRAWTTTNALDETAGEWYSSFGNGSGTWESDGLDVDDDSLITDRVRRDNTSRTILDFVVASSAKQVAGPEIEVSDPICDVLDPSETFADNDEYGAARCTRPGDRIDYELTVVNEGNVALEELVLIDLFPRPGDTLVLPSQADGTVGPRGAGSDFAPNLTGPVTSADPNVQVEYSTSANPCRGGDFYPQLLPTSASWPPGCEAPNWTSTLPVPITNVKAIRVTYAGQLDVNDSFSFAWPMRAPVTAQVDEFALNAFAWGAKSVDSTARNQSAPPIVLVKVHAEALPWEVGDRAWYDTDYDGVQDGNEPTGVEAVPFAIFFDNDNDLAFTPGIDTIVYDTVTEGGANLGLYGFNDLVNGNYFVLAAPPTSWVTSPALQGGDPAADSNFSPLGTLGDDLSVGDLDGWNPSGLDPNLHDEIWISPMTVINDDNDLTIDIGLWRPDPSIDVEKATNGADADTVPGIYIPAGQTVVWTYDVTNTGNTTLTALDLTDTTTTGTAVAVTVTCAATTLAPGASTTCAGSVTPAAQSGQYGNEVEATARPVLPGIGWPPDLYENLVNLDGSPFFDGGGVPLPVTDDDPSHYYGASPSIDIEKATIGTYGAIGVAGDADTAPGLFVDAGQPVGWYYVVENTGNVDLELDFMVDDQIGVFGDDGDPGTPELACDSGSLSFPVTIAAGETLDCMFAGGDAQILQYANSVDIAGLPVDDQGDPIPNFDGAGVPTGTFMAPVTDDDPSHYYGVVSPAIDVEKSTSGTGPTGPVGPSDSDVAPGDTLAAGTAVTWTYRVQNTGNVDLRIESLTDDEIGVFGDDGDPGTPPRACDGGTLVFPMVLTPGTSATCTATGVAVLGAYANTVAVEGVPLDTVGVEITAQESPTGTVPVTRPTDTDPSHYTGDGGPVVVLDKTTSGYGYDQPTATLGPIGPGDGIALTDGYDLTWNYTITNPGDIHLGSVVLVDDAGTPSDPSDDVTVSVSSDAATAGDVTVSGIDPTAVNLTGDTGADGILSDGEVWTVTIDGVAALGTYGNDAGVTASPLDDFGDPLENPDGSLVPDVTDDDDSSYEAFARPAVDLEKATNGDDADTPTGPHALESDSLTWTFTVTNTGGTALVDLTVTDPDLGGTICVVDLLVPGASDTCDVTGVRFGSGQQRNDAAVSGLPAAPSTPPGDFYDPDTWDTDRAAYTVFTEGGVQVPPVTDEDPSHHFGSDPAIDIEKATEDEDADLPADAPVLTPGDPVTWTYEVTNTGNAVLDGVTVTDEVDEGDDAGEDIAVSCPETTLAPGASMTCEATGVVGVTLHANVATVVAQPLDGNGDPLGDEITDSDPSHYRPAVSDLVLTKNAVGELVAGGSATWSITVRNDGPDPVDGTVTVTDSLPGELTYVSAGDPWTCATATRSGGGTDVVCEHPGPLAVDDSVELVLVTSVAADATGVANEASVDSANVDTEPDNNTGVASAVVAEAPIPSATPSSLPATGAKVGSLVIVGLWMILIGVVLRLVVTVGQRRP